MKRKETTRVTVEVGFASEASDTSHETWANQAPTSAERTIKNSVQEQE